MKSLDLLGRVCVAIVVIASVCGVAATAPPKERTDPASIPLSEIDRSSVRVRPAERERGPAVSFLFRDKDFKQVRSTLARSKSQRVRILDGTKVLVEAKLWGPLSDERNGKNKGGLILLFPTVEEASQAAAALRPFLK